MNSAEPRLAGAFTAVANPPAIQNNSATVSVPSRVVILHVRGRGKATAVATPKAITGTATENTASIRVTPPDSPHASILLFRNDMHIATFPAQKDPITYTDATAWVNPGLGYRYAAQTVALDGSLSERVEAIVQTPAKYPDLVVGDFGVAPGTQNIKPGDLVRFEAVLKNQGDGATPNPTPASVGMWDSSLTITFRVNGKVVGWGGDTGQSPLAAGAERLIKITGGPTPTRGWIAEEGTHVLQAQADDIWRIGSERRRENNLATKTLTIGDYKGLLQMESRPAPGSFNLESGNPLDWVHFAGWKDGGKILRKNGANLIGDVAQTGNGHVAVNPGCAVHLQPANNRAGLWGNGVGNGYEFEVPAGTKERVLKVFVSASNGGKGEFSAELSDASAPLFVDTGWNGDQFQSWSAVPGEFSAVYTLRFRAASENQTLKVRWRLADEPNRFLAQIRLQAAVLY